MIVWVLAMVTMFLVLGSVGYWTHKALKQVFEEERKAEICNSLCEGCDCCCHSGRLNQDWDITR